jgi:hypothetical protein
MVAPAIAEAPLQHELALAERAAGKHVRELLGGGGVAVDVLGERRRGRRLAALGELDRLRHAPLGARTHLAQLVA